MRTHDWIDRRSLALHEAVAAKLERQPELLDVARRNLARWLAHYPSPALEEWRDVLRDRAPADIVRLLRSPDASATRMRQSSPFAGVLTPRERQAILDDHDPRRA
jgi:hypothetical protein